MCKSITVELPDDVYEPLVRLADAAGRTPEAFVGRWLAAAVEHLAQSDAPISAPSRDWYTEHRGALQRLRELPANRDGMGAGPVPEAVIATADHVLQACRTADLPPAALLATASDTIMFRFQGLGQAQPMVKLECYDGDVVAIYPPAEPGGSVQVEGVEPEQLSDHLARIRELVG